MLLATSLIYHIFLLNAFTRALTNQFRVQYEDDRMGGWTVKLSENWQVLGPFSQHAREQHFVSPSYPIDLTNGWPVNFDQEHYSPLSDGARVRWSNVTSHEGNIALEFPEVRWKELRLSEGWASLQHHALLFSELVVSPPLVQGAQATSVPIRSLLADVQQVSFFTIIPEIAPLNYTPVWHTGNIYGLANTPAQNIELPSTPSTEYPTKYHVFASGDYEIRLFGDPLVMEGQEVPIQRLVFKLYPVRQQTPSVQLEPQLDVLPDFIDGWAFAQNGSMGIGVKSFGEGSWEVTVERPSTPNDGIEWFAPVLKLAPYQSRILPLQMIQGRPYHGHALIVNLQFTPYKCDSCPMSNRDIFRLSATIRISHKPPWNTGLDDIVYKASYFIGSTPFYFMTKPPQTISPYSPTILALHGAGVEASSNFWTDAIKRQAKSWVVFPTGRTAWGYDWRGPSTLDVWGSLEALAYILQTREAWSLWSTKNPRVIFMGHSNGGQGVWYHAERFPDRVLAAIPAAAYTKSQSYVPMTQSRGGHFMDASLRGILECSLQPDDNDVFLSNLVSIRLMVVHGGADENVPTWHSRQLVDGIKIRYAQQDVLYHEEAGAPHWWDTVFTNDAVQSFLDSSVEENAYRQPLPTRFTLTVAIPEESGSLHGFLIQKLEVPGRLGRLRVDVSESCLNIVSANVWEYSFDVNPEWHKRCVIADGKVLVLPKGETAILLSRGSGTWQIVPSAPTGRPSGPLHRILAGKGALIIVIPEGRTRYLSAAVRIAHNLLSYLRIDSDIVNDHEALRMLTGGDLGCSNFVVMGGYHNTFGQALMSHSHVPITFRKGGWMLRNHVFESSGLGLAFLHPHPRCDMGLSLFMASTDDSGLERILRLFPLRTGVMSPEWIITGPDADGIGAGGLLGVGYWGRDWEWSETQSWMGFN